jgi:D-alanyl-D-alanine carboxypeptidase
MKKKLNLDTKLATYFPQLPNSNKVIIEEMLYHRSCLHDYTHDTNFPDWMDKLEIPFDLTTEFR